MSIPASLRGGPITTNTVVMKRYIILHVILMWLSLLIPIYGFTLFSYAFYRDPVYFFIFLPLDLFAMYGLWALMAIFFARILLFITNLIYKPKEGYFPRDPKNKDYRYWSMRATIKKFAFWAAHNFPLPWLDVIAFRFFGVKAGLNTPLFDAWVDTEFIEIGENSIIGQGSVVMSTMVTPDFLIIKKVKIGNNVIVGAHSVISPGTTIEDNCVLGAIAGTSVGQTLESGWVYMGVPARKYKKNEYLSEEESEEELARKQEMFKQILTLEDLEEIEERKTWKDKRAEKKAEKDKLKEQKRIEKEKEKELKEKEKERKLLEKEKERLEKEKTKEEKERMKALEKEQMRTEKEKNRILKEIAKEKKKVEQLELKYSKQRNEEIEPKSKQERKKQAQNQMQEPDTEKIQDNQMESKIIDSLIKYHEEQLKELKKKKESINNS